MKHIFGLIAMLSLILSGCVEEKAPGCGLWKLEINNPEASVKVENGRLIVLYPYLNVVGACVSPHQARVAVNFLGFSRVCHTI